MRTLISRWFLFGLLLGGALTHANVFGQQGGKTPDKPAAVDKIRQTLDKTITLDYTGQSLAEVLNHFREKTGLAISIDPSAFMPPQGLNPAGEQIAVTIKGTNEKAGQILRRTLSANHLAYVIIDDAILVTAEETAVARQMRQRVSVDLDEVPLKKAVRDLAKSRGINLVIDPKVMNEAELRVCLQLDNASVETTLRLLAELASLKAVRMGNVVFICSEDKAKKIQAEEVNQFDNPLNPNNPGLYPQILNFGFAGGFGGGGFGGGGGAMPIQKVLPPNVQAPPVPVEPEPIAPPPKKGFGLPAVPPPPPPPPAVQRPGAPPALPPGRQ